MTLKQPKYLFLLSALAGTIILAGGGIQADGMLKSVGVTDIFAAVFLPDNDKLNLALYLTLIASSTAIILWAGATILKGYTRRGRVIAYAALAPGLSALALPTVLGYPLSILGFTVTVSGLAIIALAAFLCTNVPGVEVGVKAWLDPREIALVAVFSALTAILTGMTGLMLPTLTGGYTHIGDTAIYVAALIFGAKVGGLVGVIGPVAADLLVGYPRWFVTVLAHGSQGFIAGLGKGKNKITQVVLLVLSGFVMSTVYFFVNVFIKGVPIAVISFARDLFGQSLVSIILGLILTKAVEKALPAIMK
jgi:uncharacterized membrane protein